MIQRILLRETGRVRNIGDRSSSSFDHYFYVLLLIVVYYFHITVVLMKILLLRLGRLGDMVMILPAIRAIQERYPEAELHAITSPDGLLLLSHIGFNKQNIIVHRHTLYRRLQDTKKIKHYLQTTTFDKIFCFENKKRTLSWLPKGAICLKPTSELQHYALRCLQLVHPAPDKWPKHAYLQATPAVNLNEQLARYAISDKTILIGLHPTYSGFDKWGKQQEKKHRLWPWKHFSLLALQLSRYAEQKGLDLKIVMDLLPHEQHYGRRIQQHSQNSIILITEPPHFKRYLHYLKRLNLLIVGNTGVMHLAAALNTQLIALFSDLEPADCGPYMPENNGMVLRAEETSSPEKGLAALSVEAVYQKVLECLSRISAH